MRRWLTITKFHCDEHGILRARVTLDGVTLDVDREFGSWQTGSLADGTRRDLLPDIAEALQAKLPLAERRRPPLQPRSPHAA